jgi:hypothetical protein
LKIALGVWFMSVIPAFRKLRQEDREFKAILHYTVRLCLNFLPPKKVVLS